MTATVGSRLVKRGASSLSSAQTRFGEGLLEKLFFFCALLSVLTTVSVIGILAFETYNFFQKVPMLDFLTGTRWTPLLEPKHYGILPLISGTVLIVLGAALVALPVGVASAVYLSEYASERTRNIIKPVLEILAGIPTVVYGFFALTFVTPLLSTIFPSISVFNAASGSIVVGIMVLPMVASLCDDALRSVPDALRQGAYSLGATSFEVSTRIVIPAGLSGIFASFVLAISRAIGETMAVTLAAGATPNLTMNPLESIQTMTAYIVQVSLGDTPSGTITYETLFAVAAVLFASTFVLNLGGTWIMRRYQEVYE